MNDRVKGRPGRPTMPYSLRQRAAAARIGYTTLLERLKAGWPLVAALRTPVRRQRVRGLAAMARGAGLPRTTVSERLRRGWTLAEALETPIGATPDRLRTPHPEA